MRKDNKIMIYESSLDGHRLEYIHHLYCSCVKNRRSCVFSLPYSFNDIKSKLDWPANKGDVTFSFFDNSGIEKSSNFLQLSYRKSKSIIREARKNKSNNIFLISFLEIFPLFYFMALFSNIHISGIIYKIYLYKWKDFNYIKKLYICLLYFLIKISTHTYKCFILNDYTAAIYLNKIWNSGKFEYLPDPINCSSPSLIKPPSTTDKIRFLHFGALTKRKGTINILEAIDSTDSSYLSNYEFIFAGKLYDEISFDFWRLIESIGDKASIVVKDYFLDYDELDRLCSECSVLLAPYSNTDSSSGVVSYAAKYNKPVIVPNSGMLAKLVKRNHLGICINNNSADCIKDFFVHFQKVEIDSKHSQEYLANNSIRKFCDVIFFNLDSLCIFLC